MGGLGHYLEEEGLATTSISLIRLHTEKIRPPRALWVPFELGRPLGEPNNPALQKEVLMRTLGLFEAAAGPVLEDLDLPAPNNASQEDAAACPVAFESADAQGQDPGSPERALLAEVAQLGSWYSLALSQRGRSTAGTSNLAPGAAAEFMVEYLGGKEPQPPRAEISLGWNLKLALEDLKAYYLEAVSVRPDCAGLGSAALNDWFWQETAAATVIKLVRKRLLEGGDKDDQMVAKLLLVPVGR